MGMKTSYSRSSNLVPFWRDGNGVPLFTIERVMKESALNTITVYQDENPLRSLTASATESSRAVKKSVSDSVQLIST